MLVSSVDAIFFTGVEDKSFQDRETGQQVIYYKYNFVSDDEQGTPVTLNSKIGSLASGIKKFETCYPVLELTWSREGARVSLKSIERIANE